MGNEPTKYVHKLARNGENDRSEIFEKRGRLLSRQRTLFPWDTRLR